MEKWRNYINFDVGSSCCWKKSVAIGGGGVSPRGGVCPRGCLPRGVSAQEGVSAPVHAGIHTTPSSPLWTEFLTHACENITFPQLRCRR